MNIIRRGAVRIVFWAVVVALFVSACATGPASTVTGPAEPPPVSRTGEPVLTWPGDPATSIAVSWFRDGASGRGSPPAVDLRLPDGTVRRIAGETVGPVARVVTDGLEPGTTYGYRLEGEQSWRQFTTAPAVTDGLAFAVAGDLQPFNAETDRTTTMALAKIAGLDPAFVLQIGDVSEIGISRRSVRRAVSILSTLGAETPLVVTAGNHDYYYGLSSARLFKTVFPAPYVSAAPRRDTWFSQTIGPVHIAVLDTEADGSRFDAQLDWLQADLAAAAERQGTDWLFIAMHRPILATTTMSEDQRWARALLPLVAEHEVDAVFWGHDHQFEHYEFQYGANGYVFDPAHTPAVKPTHLFTVGTSGARVDALYSGFFTHKPYREVWEMVDRETGEPVTLEFFQRPWSADNVKREMPGVRYQDPAVYPDAASYYSYPFESAADAAAGRYSTDPAIRYSDDAEFFGYTYGETSIHYLWVEIRGDTCIITAHYVDGPPGGHGEVITTPDGAPQRWVLERGAGK